MKQSALAVVATLEALILVIIWISWMTRTDTITADKNTVVLSSAPLPVQQQVTTTSNYRPFFPTKFLDREQTCLDILSRKPSNLMPSNPPNRELPAEYKDLFLLGGRASLGTFYVNDNFKRYSHNEQDIERWVTMAKNEDFSEATYRKGLNTELFRALKDFPIQGKSVLILGSQRPWFEAVAIAFGASKVTTLEYNKIDYSHPKIKTITNQEYFSPENLPNREQFDVAFSISSYEHDGLGRYGDPLDPYGDLKAMLSVKCILKEGGRLFLAVPYGNDRIEYNAHRVYGKYRMPMLLNRYLVLQSYGIGRTDQPVWVLDNSAFMEEGKPGEPFVEPNY